MGKLLRYSGTVFVPAERVSALEAIKHEALGLMGGYTATPGEGGYVGSDGRTVIQPAVVVKVWTDDKAALRHWTVSAIETLKGYGEESVLFETSAPDGSSGGITA